MVDGVCIPQVGHTHLTQLARAGMWHMTRANKWPVTVSKRMTSCFDWKKVKHECIGIENTATFGGPHHAGLGVVVS